MVFSLLYGIFHCLGDSGTSGFDGEPFVTASLSFSFYWRFLFKIDFSMSMFYRRSSSGLFNLLLWLVLDT